PPASRSAARTFDAAPTTARNAPTMATRQGSVTAAFDRGGGRVACSTAPTTTQAASTAYAAAAMRRWRCLRRTAATAATPARAEARPAVRWSRPTPAWLALAYARRGPGPAVRGVSTTHRPVPAHAGRDPPAYLPERPPRCENPPRMVQADAREVPDVVDDDAG